MVVQTKFEEERIHYIKEFHLRVCNLPKTMDPLQAGHVFLHVTLDLKNNSDSEEENILSSQQDLFGCGSHMASNGGALESSNLSSIIKPL